MADKGGTIDEQGGAVSRIRPSVILPGQAAPADEQSAVIDELRNEVTTLKRELRLLRMANAELERVAVRDTLTPLYNRRYFLMALHERLVRARRYQTKAAILFVDMNRMKHINDVHGHSAGDYALVHTAQVLATHIRSTDVAARIGGDEFAIILEELDDEQATAKADQLDDVLRHTPCEYGDVTLPVSASIGLAMLDPADTEDSLIQRADADMYSRKRAFHGSEAEGRSGGRAAA